eukprot:Gb_12458 [translate_table: standard]
MTLMVSLSAQVCRVLIQTVELHQITIVLSHSHCGHSVKQEPNGTFICSFCLCSCDEEVIHNFSFIITLADNTANMCAYCSGQSAAELLQVSADEFRAWPELFLSASDGVFMREKIMKRRVTRVLQLRDPLSIE